MNHKTTKCLALKPGALAHNTMRSLSEWGSITSILTQYLGCEIHQNISNRLPSSLEVLGKSFFGFVYNITLVLPLKLHVQEYI